MENADVTSKDVVGKTQRREGVEEEVAGTH